MNSVFFRLFLFFVLVILGFSFVLFLFTPRFSAATLTLILLPVSVGIIWAGLRHILNPLAMLSALAAEFIRKGEIDENRYVAAPGDMGILAAAFYRLAEAFDIHAQELKPAVSERQRLIRAGEHARARSYYLRKASEKLTRELEAYQEREKLLSKSEERYRAMLENIEEYFYEVDLLGHLVFFNDAMYKMLGYTREELLGKNFRELMDEDTAEKAFQVFRKAYETGQPLKDMEWRLIRKDGTMCHVEISVSLIKDDRDDVIGFRGIARNVSELIYLVYHDSLTGLYNRKAFFERLRETVAYAKRDRNEKNILYMDLDRFKQVNDYFGHDVGDEVLRQVASRLRITLRETDHICRLGGDEFTVILNNTVNPKPEEAAQRVIQALSLPYTVRDDVIDFIAPSIGISSYPEDAQSIESLIKCADMTMYEAKKKGGHYCFYKDIPPDKA